MGHLLGRSVASFLAMQGWARHATATLDVGTRFWTRDAGTSRDHSGPRLTDRHYSEPSGSVNTDRALLDEIGVKLGQDGLQSG
jgi:hypothetical protein